MAQLSRPSGAGSSGVWQAEIAVEGLRETTELLAAFAPKAKKQFAARLAAAADEVAKQARSNTPVSLAGGGGSARKGIEVKRGGDKRARFGFRVVQTDIGGAIIEWAGNKSDGKTPQSRRMIATLRSRYGPAPRFMWKAWDQTKAKVLHDVGVAIAQAEQDLQAAFDQGASSTIKSRPRKG
jgi:hypothetical protein